MSLARQTDISDIPVEVIINGILPYLNYAEAIELYVCFVLNSIDRPACKLNTNDPNNNNRHNATSTKNQELSTFVKNKKNQSLFFACKNRLENDKVICKKTCVLHYSSRNSKIIYRDKQLEELLRDFDSKKIKDIYDGAILTAVITEDKALYTSVNSSTLNLNEQMSEEGIVAIAGGVSHMMVMTKCGNIFSTGFNHYGQAGPNGSNYIHPNSFKQVNLDGNKIVAICAGDYFSLVLTQDGEVLGFGENTFDQLGVKNKNAIEMQIIDIEDKRIKEIAAGGRHSLFLTDDNQIYGCGSNEDGQLGFETRRDKNGNIMIFEAPTLIKSLKDMQIIGIAAGNCFSMALTADHEVYVLGGTRDTRAGFRIDSNSQTTKLNFKEGVKIIAISACKDNYAFLTSTGEVYTKENIEEILEKSVAQQNTRNCRIM